MPGTAETPGQGTGHCPRSIGSTGSSSSEDLPRMNNIKKTTLIPSWDSYTTWNIMLYYPTLLPRVQISRETSTNNRYLYSPHSSRPREVQNLGKSEFWEKKSLDNKSLIRRFGV